MFYAVINESGQPTGALYVEVTPSVRAHHPGATFEPCSRLANDGTAESPTWRTVPPAIEDLRSSWVLTRFQLQDVLASAGLLASAEQLVAASPDPRIGRAWTYGVEFPRASATITALGAALNLSAEELDDLFRAGVEIEA